jgi:hypothetical protein
VSTGATTAETTDETTEVTTEVTDETIGATAAEPAAGPGQGRSRWYCSRILSISLNASANRRIVVVLAWDRGDVISPHHSCDSGRYRKSGSLRGRAQ